jgi:transitional endoplasmic reticulum ATPase
LTRKLTPNTLLVDDSVVDDHSTISLSKAKMEELGLFDGDIVLLKGKKRKNTIAVVNTDKTVDANRARMSKVIRSNLRYIYICTSIWVHADICICAANNRISKTRA